MHTIKQKYQLKNIFFSEDPILGRPTVIAYEKKFRWSWMATQMNTFIVSSDFGDEKLTTKVLESHLTESFKYASKNYNGWPRGLQSGVAVISILISSNIEEDVKNFCFELKSGKKWAGIAIPVVIDAKDGTVYSFKRDPMWGKIYFPYFRKLIAELCIQKEQKS